MQFQFWPRVLAALILSFTFALHASAQSTTRVVHVFVALADNQHQGIVPVPAKLGDGDAPASNLYWGAAFGVKSYFRASAAWQLVSAGVGPKPEILERCIFKHRKSPVYLVADAYRGSEIRDAVIDFLSAAAGQKSQLASFNMAQSSFSIPSNGGADLVAYVGHDVFMDFQIEPIKAAKGDKPRTAIILACASKQYFGPYLKQAGAEPLLWTTGLMAPEAYTLKAALDGWIANESASQIRERAAEAYDKYQHCGLRAAQHLFASGW
jgi:hypothetical protein